MPDFISRSEAMAAELAARAAAAPPGSAAAKVNGAMAEMLARTTAEAKASVGYVPPPPPKAPETFAGAISGRDGFYGSISAATVDNWRRVIADPAVPIAYRKMVYSTAATALAQIGKSLGVAEPTQEPAK